jgi:predicted RecA/RadA family phage recombinase
MSVTKIRSKWVNGLLEFFGVASGATVLKITESGIEGNVSGNVTGALSGGEVNPTIAVIAGEAISAGDLVYPSGYDATSGKIKVKKADANGTNPARAAWFVAPAAIQSAAAGVVVGALELAAQNTNAGNVGDPVYLSDATAGAWSIAAPATAGDAIQQVGVVTAQSETVGKVLLMPFYSKGVTLHA